MIQRFINSEDIVDLVDQEVFDDDVTLVAVLEGIACPLQKVIGFVDTQLQCYRQRLGGLLGGAICALRVSGALPDLIKCCSYPRAGLSIP